MAAPEQIIERIPELRGRRARLSPLGGGLTNRNYRVDTDDGVYVLRIAGPNTAFLGIDRACEVACGRAAAARGIGPEIVAWLPDDEAILWRFIPGRTLTPEDVRKPEVILRVAAALRRYHDGPPGAGRFSPFDTVRAYHALARDRGVRFPAALSPALERLSVIEQDLSPAGTPCPCHNDLLAGNFIDDGTTLRVIDWEYGGMGDRFFDLGNLAADNEFEDGHERMFLESYFGRGVRPGDLRRLRRMRLASDMREALWGFAQIALSTLEVDYMAYAMKYLERFLQADASPESPAGG